MPIAVQSREARQLEEDLQRLRGLRPIDDDFMRCLFKGNIPLAQFVLRIIINKPDLVITDMNTQADMKRLVGARSLTLDVYATDDSKRKYDIEVQREGSRATPRRARYHSSVMAVENLNAGQDFESLVDTYTIFITEKDFYGQGAPLYDIQRVNLTSQKLFDDGDFIIYVNGEYRGDSEIGKLMHDFSCSDPEDMYFKIMADRVRYLKGTKEGVDTMSNAFEELRLDSAIASAVDTYKECGWKDDQIVKRITEKFGITFDTATMYMNEANQVTA